VSCIDHTEMIAVTLTALLFGARQVYRLRWERAETREREALARWRIEHAEQTGDFDCLDVTPRRRPPGEPAGSLLRGRRG
jgi:hypothetical protein